MPNSYEIDRHNSLVRVELIGAPEDWDVAGLVAIMARDPRLEPRARMLCDLSRADGATTLDQMRRNLALLASLMERIGPFRCAVVARQDVNYGMANAASVYAADYAGLELRAFREPAEAEAWLAETGDRDE